MKRFDSSKGVLGLALLVIVGAVQLRAGAMYLSSGSRLYVGDPVTGSFNLVGDSGVSGGLRDIAFGSNNTLYGLDGSGNLYRIDPTNASASDVGFTGIGGGQLQGLAADASGNLYAGGNGAIYTISSTTGTATQIGEGGQPYAVFGDLEFVGSTLYLTSWFDRNGGNALGSELWSVDTANGVGTDIRRLLVASTTGLAYDSDNGVLYGFNPNNIEFAVFGGPSANSISVNGITGAAFSSAPEPSTFLLIGLAVTILALGRRNQRRSLDVAVER